MKREMERRKQNFDMSSQGETKNCDKTNKGHCGIRFSREGEVPITKKFGKILKDDDELEMNVCNYFFNLFI